MTATGGPRQDRHSLGDFPANRPRAASASLTSPTEMPAPGAGPLADLRVAVARSPDRAGALADALAAAGAEPVPVPLIDFETAPGAGPLAGLRVAVTRSADRAGALLAALASAGAEPVLVPVIDFEMADNDILGAALHRLEAGEYRWLVVSSITTVRALKEWCGSAGISLAALIPAATKVATIGPTSVAVLEAEGVRVDLAPVDAQSAAGLVGLWPSFTADGGGNARVLLPQSNLAEPTLARGLAEKGWDTEAVTAYQTVDYPAEPARRLTAVLAHATPGPLPLPDHQDSYPLLTPAQAAGEVRTGAINAVVLASGSAARRVAATMGPLPESCLVVAIGQPTRAEAERLGLRVAATAVHPTPDGIVAALAGSVHTSKPSNTGDKK